ncbi:hypothetical protein DRE_04840 [Drechslerella stenobrocha 248]|uniref:G-patch domain-containing protein n=1 Tax=Drechslerella stenobrocha 248 TaxID=1043628 RepID=W7I0S8_9PEZI|nr:hypothetical protein DRE_04840 [Drechslerella stenobrocha 248]
MASNIGKGMASLYAELLEPRITTSDQAPSIPKSTVILTASEVQAPAQDATNSSDQAASTKKPVSSAALRFQPIPRRPVPSQQKNIKRTGTSAFTKPPKIDAASDQLDSTEHPGGATTATRAPVIKSTLEDWATIDEEDNVNGFYAAGSRQRGGRKRRRKNKERESEQLSQSWNDIYDPSRPNLYEEYKESEERDHEVRDWRNRLYGRRRACSSDGSDDEGGPLPQSRFPPSNSLKFAPPPSNLDISTSQLSQQLAAPIINVATGDEAWMMRARITKHNAVTSSTRSLAHHKVESTSEPEMDTSLYDKPVEMGAQSPGSPTASFNSQDKSATISRAPVIYSFPPAPPDIVSESPPTEIEANGDRDNYLDPATGENAARSVRPGQKGFAERLMSKYGWTKGTGLGANSSGMVHALQVKTTKGKDNKGIGKIMDKNKKGNSEEEGKFGKMSEVVILHKMVDGLEAEDPAVLMQEIGDECSEKYGRIERVHIIHKQTEDASSKVFVQFTSQLSALRAVNALEGRLFNGNIIKARFFDADRFEKECIG